MTEETVVSKVAELMATLDNVRMYKSLAYAMVDFAGIIVGALVAVFALLIFRDAYTVVWGGGNGTGPVFDVTSFVVLAILAVMLFGIITGVYWVHRKVKLTKVGEWKEALGEGTPGAVRLLMETDWDSTLRAISLSRAAYLFYALIKVAAYSTVVFVLLSFAELFSGISYLLQPGQIYILLISVIIVLLFTWRSLGEGFRRMQSLDALFWDLRVFSTEFKRAEFNKT